MLYKCKPYYIEVNQYKTTTPSKTALPPLKHYYIRYNSQEGLKIGPWIKTNILNSSSMCNIKCKEQEHLLDVIPDSPPFSSPSVRKLTPLFNMALRRRQFRMPSRTQCVTLDVYRWGGDAGALYWWKILRISSGKWVSF